MASLIDTVGACWRPRALRSPGCWRGPGRASSPPPLGRLRFSTESRQNAFGDFQLIELVAQLCPFAIEPREPLGTPLLLLPDLVQRRHLLFPFSSSQHRP